MGKLESWAWKTADNAEGLFEEDWVLGIWKLLGLSFTLLQYHVLLCMERPSLFSYFIISWWGLLFWGLFSVVVSFLFFFSISFSTNEIISLIINWHYSLAGVKKSIQSKNITLVPKKNLIQVLIHELFCNPWSCRIQIFSVTIYTIAVTVPNIILSHTGSYKKNWDIK